MSLPLEERATVDGVLYLLTPRPEPALGSQPDGPACGVKVAATSLIPLEALQPGEQYRFHFDMTKCIGCHCCEVACNEQNGNPVGIHWRRVGEIEGGTYPFTQRLHLSMGCNHCLEPSCLTGCPVDAYTKDPETGVVLHSADTCIGCQYCTWNCPYGVPQFNPERGVVGKCDMCHDRLSRRAGSGLRLRLPGRGHPHRNRQRRRMAASGRANPPMRPDSLPPDRPSRPPASRLPLTLPTLLREGRCPPRRPEHPHWPLVFMTVLTQLSVGCFAALWLSLRHHARHASVPAAAAALATGLLALLCSTLHLGRPIHAARALRMWKRSWLSREVLLFTLFAGAPPPMPACSSLAPAWPGHWGP